MSVLRVIESKLESLFEGVFGRAFRTNVQPVELARKLVKEMDDHKSVSVSRVYVPNEYTIYLAPGDHQQFASFEESLTDELQDYLAEHARRERYVLLTPPNVKLEQDADLEIGVFGIAVRLVRGPKPAPEDAPAEQPAHGETMVYTPTAPLPAPADGQSAEAQPVAFLTIAGRRHELKGERTVLGRGKDCDIQLPDPNISRRHAEVRREDGTYVLADLDSTNGVEVEGNRVKRLELTSGIRFTIGSTEVDFTEDIA